MKLSFQTNQYAIFDDFLSPADFEEVWKYMQAESFIPITTPAWTGAWRLDDGPVMRGPLSGIGSIPKMESPYPSGFGIDLVTEAISKNSSQFRNWIGEKDKDWDSFSATPMLYPRNTSLYWHRDAAHWTGSYTYYAHSEWNIQWGGELLIADESLLQVPEHLGVFLIEERNFRGVQKKMSVGSHLQNKRANELILENGFGHYIMCKPNRLVILKGGAVHSVSKVHPAAGDHIRCSISGFFQKPNSST